MAKLIRQLLATTIAVGALATAAHAAGPEIVSGPSNDPNCFKPWTADTKFFQFP